MFFFFQEKTSFFGALCQNSVCDKKWAIYFLFSKKKSWRLCNAYSQTLRLHSSDIFCFSVHLRILI
nr:photosystem II protein I [Hosta capitata]